MRAISTACENGIWWLRRPDETDFVSVGINHFQPDCWLAPYNRAETLARYGEDLATPEDGFNSDGSGLRNLMERQQPLLRDLGFNTFGIHTYEIPARLIAKDFAYCVAIESFPLGSRYRFGEQVFPDIFAEEFANRLEDRIKAVCSEHAGNENLIGYAFSDIPRWYFYEGQALDYEPVHPWVRDLAALPPDSPGGRFYARILNQPPQDRSDSDAVLAAVVRYWYELHARLIRLYDPYHLLLGDKLHSPHRLPAWFPPILRDLVDVVLIQWYTPIEVQRPTLVKLHEWTGKPILNGDSSFAWPKPGRQSKVKGFKVPSLEAVGEAYTDYLRGVMELPFMLGWHHCGWIEQWDGGKRNNWEINENGLLDPFENPYVEVVEAVRHANHHASAWHRA